MWENLKGFLADYKMTAIKLLFALLIVFIIVQYNSYGERAAAHYIFLQIKNGIIREICIAPSKNIVSDFEEGINNTYIIVKDRQIPVEAKWGTVIPRDNLYMIIIMDKDRDGRRVYETDDINARLLLATKDKDEEAEGCRSFYHISRKAVF